MLILHVSDTHLGAIPGGLLSRARDVYEVFRETIDIALRERVDVYIHTGDFFHTPTPPPEAYVAAYRGLRKLKDRGIKVVAIAGQHDLPKRYAMSPLSILRDVDVLDHVAVDSIVSVDIEIGGRTTFICVPYSLRHRIPALSIPRDSKSVLMAHLLLKELGIPSSEADISLDAVPSGFKYIALGDYHMKTVLRHRTGALAVYPGATEVHRVSEYDKKYVALVDLGRDEARVEFVELQSVRPWIVTTCTDLPKCLSDIADNAKKLISNSKKRPIAYVAIEKVKAELMSRHLDELTSKGLIEHYVVSYRESEEAEPLEIREFTEKLEHIDIEKILKELLEDEKLVSYIRSLVENPDRHIAEELIEYLRSNVGSIKDLELRIKAKTSPLMQNKDREDVNQIRSRPPRGRLL